MPYLAASVSVMDYAADPTGTNDSTSAFNEAIAAVAAAGGGVVNVPAGTFKITPSGTSPVGISFMGTGAAGYQGVRLVGAGMYATTLVKQASGVLVQFSGPSSSAGSGTTHTKYCSIENIGLSGNGLTGNVFQTYYCDNLLFRDLYITSNPDVVLSTAEFWDSRFYNVYTQSCGSTTANASTPNFLLENSAASSGFGYTTDNVNNVYFNGCHWEGFTTGAVWVEQGPAGLNASNAIYFTDCKMETSAINGGPHLLVGTSAKGCYVNHLYAYSGGFTSGYSTAQDVIQWGCQDGCIENVFIANGSSATVQNGITLNSATAGQNVTARNVMALYTTAPTSAHVNYGTATGGFAGGNNYSNTGTQFTGNVPDGSNPISGLMQIFTASGTWTAPPGAVAITVTAIGGGGGGGSGSVEASGTVSGGGAGGGGGGFSTKTFQASMINSTETVTVGTGGTGGTAVGTSAANGNAGNAGNASYFRSTSLLVAAGGQPGGGGTTTGATGGSMGNGSFNGGAGASSSSTGAAGSAGSGASNAPPGGGSGGGITTAAASSSVGNAVGAAGTSGGGAGGAGTSVTAGYPVPGTGGGGGGSSTTGNGGAGGNGGNYGAGGGGGGAALTTHSSGAGGNGAAGLVVVVTTCAY